MKKLLLATAIAALATSAQAFQFETGVAYLSNDFDDSASAFFDYHFDDVDTSKGPLKEAAFLSHSSHVGVDYSTGDYADITGANARFVSGGGWTFGLDYFNFDADSPYSYYSYGYGVALGKYINDSSEIHISYYDSDSDYAEPTYVIGFQSVIENVSFGMHARINDGEYAVGLGGMYYINSAFGLGAGVTYDDKAEDTVFSLSASYFFTDAVELEVTYAEEVNSDDTLSAGVNFRF